MESQIKVNVAFAVDKLSARGLKKIRWAMTKTVSALAKDAKEAVTKQMPVSFDRPTPFTLRAVQAINAKTDTITSQVLIPASEEARGKSQREYVRPGAYGASSRSQKKTEFLLSKMGLLPVGWVLVPGSFGKQHLDGYGNMPGAYYKQVIRELQIRPPTDKYFKPRSAKGQQSAKKMGVEALFFVVQPGSNKLGKNQGYLPAGIYRRSGPQGRKLLQYFVMVKTAKYKQRLDMVDVVQKAVNDNGQKRFDEAMASVIDEINNGGRA